MMADHRFECGMVARCYQAPLLPVDGKQLQALGRWPLTLVLQCDFRCLDDSKLLVAVSRCPQSVGNMQ
jgi:hypothetical protein